MTDFSFRLKNVATVVACFAAFMLVSVVLPSCETEEFSVTFTTGGGGASPPSQWVKKGGRVEKPADPRRNGYEFDGWFDGDVEWDFSTAVRADLHLVAKWTAVYTVEFYVEVSGMSSPPPQIVRSGNKIEKPEDPIRANFIFEGWSKVRYSNDFWNFDTETVTEDIRLWAQWELESYPVTFDSDGGSDVEAQNVTHGQRATRPADPTRDGYTFGGWLYGSTMWNFTTVVTEPITLTASWAEVHIVTFDSDGGSAVANQNVTHGNRATRPAVNPTRSGFAFDGWFDGETEWVFTTTITASITLTAKWTALHIVTFNSNGGSARNPLTVRHGETATSPANPTRSGFVFDGWFYDGTEWNFATVITAPITLTAQWTRQYTVTFNSTGGTPTPQQQTVREGGRVVRPSNPTRTNNIFVGWAKENNETSALWDFDTETVTANMTLFARWELRSYLVTFDSNGGTSVDDQNIAHGSTATIPANPTREGFEFDGWFRNNSAWNFTTAITAPITLTARWTATHTVTFDSDGGSAVEAQTIRHGSRATQPAVDPTREGFAFDGWFNGNTQWNFNTTITAPITLTARWTALHTVTFDSDGGSAVAAQTIRHGNRATRPAVNPTRAGFVFDGWFSGDTEWNFNNTITAPITLTAKWTAAHIVTFNSNGGSAVAAQTIRHGNTATRPTNPTRSGFAFDGWFDGDAEWNFNTAITAPITLTAKWTVTHTVTFNSNGGSAVSSQTIRDGSTANRPANPTRAFTPTAGLYEGTLTTIPSNHTFVEWRRGSSSTAFDFSAPITESITLTAVWNTPLGSPISSVPGYDVDAVVTYVNANSTGGNGYTLLLGANAIAGDLTINMGGARLNIMGIGTERTITASGSNRRMFTIDGNNANLTLGQNITLSGGNIHVLRGTLTMRSGSKITGFNMLGAGAVLFHVVYVNGSNATFTMEGGEITGNSPAAGSSIGSVNIGDGATFNMSGGSITGNLNLHHTIPQDVYINPNCTFRLSGSATIGNLMLNATGATSRPSISINGSHSGSITALYLRGTAWTNELINWWTNAPIIVNGNTTVINRFNNALGNFVSDRETTSPAINATHQINSSGVLVLK